jgi:hypothetical protein
MVESLELVPNEPLALLPRSRLASLVPINLNGPDREALHSYLFRVAAAHRSTPRSVATALLCEGKEMSTAANVSTAGEGWASWREPHFNGLSAKVARWVQRLERATCRSDLEKLTLLPFRRLVQPIGALHEWLRWCPQCVAESDCAYHRLSWSVRAVTACTTHNVVLSSRCPHCSGYERRTPIAQALRYCAKCGGDLTQHENVPADAAKVVLSRLVEEFLTENCEGLSPSGVRTFLNRAVKRHEELTPGDMQN